MIVNEMDSQRRATGRERFMLYLRFLLMILNRVSPNFLNIDRSIMLTAFLRVFMHNVVLLVLEATRKGDHELLFFYSYC